MTAGPGPVDVALGTARIRFRDDELRVETGVVERRWRRTRRGLRTVSLRHRDGGEWIAPAGDADDADWSLPYVLGPDDEPHLEAATCEEAADLDGGADHLVVDLTFHCDSAGLALRYRVRAWPDAAGLWVSLSARRLRDFAPEALPSDLGGACAESLDLAAGRCRRRAVGFYNDTQHRNRAATPIRLQETRAGTIDGWEAWDRHNLLTLERGDGAALTWVKESNRCVNQPGIGGGAFELRADHARVTGLGWGGLYDGGDWLREDWRESWGTWCLLHVADPLSRQRAIKDFDRRRYPFRPQRDMWLMANTWGSRGAGDLSRAATQEDSLLREIASCADLGLDMLQIDDGWQCAPGDEDRFARWRPHPERLPGGWQRVRAAADAAGLELGLWFAWTADLEDMVWNLREGRFRRFKLDFANFRSRDDLDAFLAKARAVVDAGGPGFGINWDVTENAVRMGYFLGRDLGNLYLENRPQTDRTGRIHHVTYRPGLVLRDAWQLAHELNLNQVQLPVQNVDRVQPELSDAGHLGHAWAFAVTWMGVPIFFQETQFYDAAARAVLRPLIALYRKHRAAILRGVVCPLGAEPDGAAWTGFQSHDPETGGGYLTVFREPRARAGRRTLDLPWPAADPVRVTDLLDDDGAAEIDAAGRLHLSIPTPGRFRILRYLPA